MSNWKTFLRRSETIGRVMDHIRCAQTKRRYYALCAHYASRAKRTDLVGRGPSNGRGRRDGHEARPGLTQERLRMVWVGVDQDQDVAGIVQGLEAFGEVCPFVSDDGRYGQIWPRSGDVRPIRELNGQRLLSFVRKTMQTGPLHVLVGQMWNMSMDPRVLGQIRAMGVPIVNIAMDDRHTFKHWKRNGLWTGTYGLIPSLDLACTAAKECREWYVGEGCRAIYLPEASDPHIFRPSDIEKTQDVCFIGAKYGIREKIVSALRRAGISVTTRGSGWPEGRIATSDIPNLFAQSRIVLGVGTIRTCPDFYALKMRDFDAPMSGTLYLTHHNPDLEALYDIGKEIETYSHVDECIDKVHYYMKNPTAAQSVGQAGRQRAERDHTWRKRFEQVLATLGLIQRRYLPREG